MPKSDLEVFEYLSSDPQTSLHVDYLTYAIFTHDKHSWIAHFEAQHGRLPTQEEIDTWISNITEQQFGRMMDAAVEFFDNAARAYLADELATEQEKTFQGTLVKTVTQGLSFKRQLGLSLLSSILSPIILGLILVSIVNYDRWFPSVVKLFQ